MESTPARQAFQLTIARATSVQILQHLDACSAQFRPPLADRVDLPTYAEKLFDQSVTFEAWCGNVLAGLVACYVNEQTQPASAFVSNVSVLAENRSQGIARRLMILCHDEVKRRGVQVISLEVSSDNTPAIRLYTQLGYIKMTNDGGKLGMQLSFGRKMTVGEAASLSMPG
ncbi:GNAT family N-acetyltransferase [Rhodopirellula sp. JC639]|uniref:GNAT family N-acetyltransferase n=1 Tax=Stieleria mannarensis TaxID=2755585 RepID=UPI0016047977|nr:GNAT family N-acetyltransferase [Rhodopirellula sp. JC639]